MIATQRGGALMPEQPIPITENSKPTANCATPNMAVLSQWFEWATESGVLPISPKQCETVFTNSPERGYEDKSLSVFASILGCIIAVDTLTGRHYQFTGDEVSYEE